MTFDSEAVFRSGVVYGLISNMPMAARIVKAAKAHHWEVRNFDRSEALLESAKQKPPCLVILDCDGCEAEGFKVLKVLAGDADLKKVPVVGYVSLSKMAVKTEVERAGCLRVYPKTEFLRILDDLMVRYAR